MKRMKILLFILFFTQLLFAQQDTSFVELVKINPHIRLDIRYATTNNFLKAAVYPEARCFLRSPAAKALHKIQKELETIGLGLKVFDGYRPLSVQRKMWEIVPNSHFVANPQKGSRHNRGMAVDLTLVDSTGKELQMPTGFDNFTVKARHNYQKLPARVRQNRWILKTIMEKYGFSPISSEWWHYDFKGWKKYKVLDISFERLDKIIKNNGVSVH